MHVKATGGGEGLVAGGERADEAAVVAAAIHFRPDRVLPLVLHQIIALLHTQKQKNHFLKSQIFKSTTAQIGMKKNSVVDPHHVGSETFSRIRADKLKILSLI